MSFVDTLRQWDEAVTCADKQEWSEALSILLSIQQPNSKICFDIGCLHLLNQDLDAAEKVRLDNEAKCQAILFNFLFFSHQTVKSSTFCWCRCEMKHSDVVVSESASHPERRSSSTFLFF